MNPNNLVALKTTDTSFATIGDIITYTIVLTNNGSLTNNNVILTDLIPQGANFINGSIYVNNLNTPGNPALGITVPDMAVLDVSTITFKAQVVNVPTDNPIQNIGQIDYQFSNGTTLTQGSIDTNTVITYISTPVINVTKQAPSTTKVGDILTFSITVNNIGSTTANNITFLDTMPIGTTFISNSLNVNGTTVPGADPSPPTGFNAGNLPAGYYGMVKFNVNVVSIPPSGAIQNIFDVTYDYTINPITLRTSTGRASSNITTSTISNQVADLSGITKSVDKSYVTCGDILTFTITIPNSGSLTATNVVLVDTLSSGLNFVPNSVVVNGITIPNLPSSIPVGSIVPSGISTVTFMAQVSC